LNPASHLKGLISCDNTPERSGSVPAMKKQIPISKPRHSQNGKERLTGEAAATGNQINPGRTK